MSTILCIIQFYGIKDITQIKAIHLAPLYCIYKLFPLGCEALNLYHQPDPQAGESEQIPGESEASECAENM